MASPISVVLVNCSAKDTKRLVRILDKSGFETVWERVHSAPALSEALTRRAWDIILADYDARSFAAPEALAVAKAHAPEVPFILVSGTAGEHHAVEMMQAGASDYVMKDSLQR